MELSCRKKVSPTSKERPLSVSIWDWNLEHLGGFRGFRIGGLNERDNMAGGLFRIRIHIRISAVYALEKLNIKPISSLCLILSF